MQLEKTVSHLERQVYVTIEECSYIFQLDMLDQSTTLLFTRTANCSQKHIDISKARTIFLGMLRMP